MQKKLHVFVIFMHMCVGGLHAALMQLHQGCRLEKWFPPQYNGDSVSQCCFRKGASSPGAFCADTLIFTWMLRGTAVSPFKEPVA